MAGQQQHRRAELIAAALVDELSPEERDEFDQMRAQGPSVEQELDEMTDVVTGLRTAVTQWQEEEPPSTLREAVRAIPSLQAGNDTGDGRRLRGGRRRRRPLRMVAAAAGCFLLGIAVTLGVQAVQDIPPQGPPGTYGAVETVDFTVDPDDAEIEAALIAHTWGTETVLEVEGLAPGESFSVVLISEAGEEVGSGAFLGSEVLIECRLNADVMRDDVTRLEILGPEGEIIGAADLPDAIDPEAPSAHH